MKLNIENKNIKCLIKPVSIGLAILVLCYLILNYVPFFANNKVFSVLTQSMEPVINSGDVVVVNTNFEIDSLEEEDIIAFYMNIDNEEEKEVVIHYVANIQKDGADNYIINTKPWGVTQEASWDEWTITEDDIIGVYNFKVEKLGSIVLFLSSTFGKVIVIIDIIIIYLIIEFFTKKESGKQK